VSATTPRRRRQRPREATPAAGALACGRWLSPRPASARSVLLPSGASEGLVCRGGSRARVGGSRVPATGGPRDSGGHLLRAGGHASSSCLDRRLPVCARPLCRRPSAPPGRARCDLATRGEHEHGRERRPEVPTCQVRAAGTTEVVGWRARGAPGLLALGTAALADAGIGVAVCFVYYQVARRSMLALAAWPTCVGALVLAAAFHGSIEVLALDMAAASAALVVGLGIPSLVNVLLSLADDTASLSRQAVLLEPATVDLTVVVPCRNVGATRLATHLRRICEVLAGAGVVFEVAPEYDGSSDGSERAFDELPGELVRPIVWSDNRGKGEAPGIGLAHGHGRYLGFIDADGDIPADGLAQFVAVVRRQQPDVVVGSKRPPQAQGVYPPLRRVYSKGYQCLTRLLLGLRVRDTQSGVKLVRRDVVAEVLPRIVEKRFAFDLELLAVAHRLGYRQVAELPVTIGERFSSTISARSVSRMLQDTLATFWRLRVLRFYDPPLTEASVTEQALAVLGADAGAGSLAQVAASATAASASPPWLGEAGFVGRAGVLASPAVVGSTEPAVPGVVRGAGDLAERLSSGQRLRILLCNWRDLAHPRAGGAEVHTQRVAAAYWAVPYGLELASTSMVSAAAQRRWGWAADCSTLANTLWLNSAWNWHGQALYLFAADFHHFPLVLWRYAVPLVAFAALGVAGLRALTRHDQQRLGLLVAAAVLALVVVVLASGTRAPGAPLFALVTAVPFGWLVEDPGRFLFAAGAAYAVMVAVLVDQWHVASGVSQAQVAGAKPAPTRVQPWQWLAPVGLCIVMVVPAYPPLTGGATTSAATGRGTVAGIRSPADPATAVNVESEVGGLPHGGAIVVSGKGRLLYILSTAGCKRHGGTDHSLRRKQIYAIPGEGLAENLSDRHTCPIDFVLFEGE